MARTPSSLESNENRKLLDRWDRHFRWSGAFLLGKTPIGRVTIPNDVDCALLLGADASRDPIAEAELVEDELETTNMGMTGSCALAPDWTARRLLYGGMEGKISFFDLETSEHGTLVALPGRPQIMDLGLSENRRSLLCLCRHDALSRKMRKPLALQIWDYRALWEVAAR